MSDDFAETHWEKAARTRMGIYLTKTETEFLRSAIDLSKCHTVVDIGSGAGKFSLLAAQRNADVVSLDIELHALKRLRTKDRRIAVVLADAKNPPLKNEIACAVLSFEVLDYVPELKMALSEFNRILKPGRPLVFSFGNRSSLKSRLRQMSGKRYTHSYGEAISALSEIGFKIEKKKGYNWLLFGRTSESLLIPLLARLEKAIGLQRLARWSPWVLVEAEKASS
jgi:ubiquinone/menaquinone biosynthesis C-methylase UbiE